MSYYLPTKIIFGQDAINNNKELLKELGCRALLVTGRSSARASGALEDMERALQELGIVYFIFDQVEENPSVETILEGRRLGLEKEVDFLIGIGGGSPMDAAKAISVFIKNPQLEGYDVFSSPQLAFLPVVAVATTSGTGSEVTQYSIVTSKKERTKKNLGQTIFPELAFLDPSYTYSLSREVTISTGIDAFTHLVEGYLNTRIDPYADILAERGFSLFKELFPKMLASDFDQDFRRDLMLASSLGGMVIAQNGTSLPHGMGYALTYFKGLAHGLANGVLTPAFLRAFQDKTRLNRMLELMGLNSLDDLEEIFASLIKLEIDISSEELEEYIRDFYSNKEKLRNFPQEISMEGVLRIYKDSLL